MRRVALVLVCIACAGAARSASAPYQREGRAAARPERVPCDEIIFVTRTISEDPHWYANISYFCKSADAPAYSTEGRLLAYNVKTGKFRALLVNPSGSVRDPVVHYDGKTILFSYRPGGTGSYHLYTINADGSKTEEQPLDAASLKDNTETLYICVPAEANFITDVVRAGNTVTVSAGSDVPGAAVFCAVYDQDGKLLEVLSQSLAEGEDCTFVFADGSFTSAKAFLLDGKSTPLCASKEA